MNAVAPDVVKPFVPGPGGYVIAAVLSWFVFALIYLTPDLLASGQVAAAVIYLPLTVLFCATYGMPVTLLGILVVHVVLRKAHSLVVQAVLAGAVAWGLAALWISHTYPGDLEPVDGPWSGSHQPLVAVAVGAAAAVGRLVADRWLPPRR